MNKKLDAEEKLKSNDESIPWLEQTREWVKAANEAHHSLKNNNFRAMSKFLKKAGLNLYIMDKNLSIEFAGSFFIFRE